jgi:hypothetical protein
MSAHIFERIADLLYFYRVCARDILTSVLSFQKLKCFFTLISIININYMN